MWACTVPLVVMICACQAPADSSDSERDPMLAPVTEADAPRMRDLLAQGYVMIDQHAVGYSCGPDCYGEGFDAAYLGRESDDPDELGVAEFACPGMTGRFDDWKCRRIPHPYVPNGGCPPEPAHPPTAR